MREQLIHLLSEAAEVEHNLLCSYLYAAFSLKRAGEGLSTEEERAVERWRKTITGVAIEEMGHLAIVNNLLVAVGGDAHFQRPNLPVPPGYHPASFDLRLAPFSESTLEHFIFLERPQHSNVRDAPGYRHQEAGRAPPGREWITPVGTDYHTIGEFYAEILDAVRVHGARAGSAAFVDDGRQVPASHIGIAGVIVIHDAAGAFAALKKVIDQGEGASQASDDCHFAHFSRIREEWERLRRANPGFQPAHPAAMNPVMRKPVGAGRTWIRSAAALPLLDLGNALYGLLLLHLARMYQPIEAAERRRLADAAIKLMHRLSAVAQKLARLPADESGSVNAGLTFAVPRNIGARGHADILAERLAEVERLSNQLSDGGHG